MKIVIAPNALKGSLSAAACADAIAIGLQRVLPNANLIKTPVADGGDGLLAVLADQIQAKWQTVEVTGPTGKPVQAAFLFQASKKIAIIEMVAAAGLALLEPEEYQPMLATTYGVGELIVAALELGAKHIVLGLGGSATTDAGTGLASALGIKFLDNNGNRLVGNGAALIDIVNIDCRKIIPEMADITLDIMCDVINPLFGINGTASVYGPQKGATPQQIIQLEQGLINFATLIKKNYHIDVQTLPGAGAAGGLSVTLLAFCNATLQPGAELILDLLAFDEALTNADLVITAEGRLDYQTGFGKAPAVVAARARKYGIPTVVIAGDLAESAQHLQRMGFAGAMSLCSSPMSIEYAMANASYLVSNTAQQLANIITMPFIRLN